MNRMLAEARKATVACLLSLAVCVPLDDAQAGRYAVLHIFAGAPTDGAIPVGGLVRDEAGNLYGATRLGGGGTACQGTLGCGTVFKLASDGSETLLHSFCNKNNCEDGFYPSASLTIDGAGNLYGVTSGGGADGYGIVFKIAPDGAEKMVYSFKGGADGEGPESPLHEDKNGNFYGTTVGGGGTGCVVGCGTVFKLTSRGDESVLYAFQGGSDGEYPSGPITERSGNIYGSTPVGGGGHQCSWSSIGCGTIFMVTAAGKESVLYAFQGGMDGGDPTGVALDKKGNVIGTSEQSGIGKLNCPRGCGNVFKVASNGSETVLYSFQAGDDGADPAAAPILDTRGNIFGTVWIGGRSRHCRAHDECGGVFELRAHGGEKMLHRFRLRENGRMPESELVVDPAENFYGTTDAGGTVGGNCGTSGCGVIFKLIK